MPRINNYAKAGLMTGCKLEKETWAGQVKCYFSTKSSFHNRCMHFVQGCVCDNHNAQMDLTTSGTPALVTPPSSAYDLTSMKQEYPIETTTLKNKNAQTGRYLKIQQQAIKNNASIVTASQARAWTCTCGFSTILDKCPKCGSIAPPPAMGDCKKCPARACTFWATCIKPERKYVK